MLSAATIWDRLVGDLPVPERYRGTLEAAWQELPPDRQTQIRHIMNRHSAPGEIVLEIWRDVPQLYVSVAQIVGRVIMASKNEPEEQNGIPVLYDPVVSDTRIDPFAV